MFPSAKDKDPSGMIEMDRFVTTLRGRSNEVIERHSVLSAATMRHHVTNDRYHITHIDRRQFLFDYCRLRREIIGSQRRCTMETHDCGLPSNLLVPRWRIVLYCRKQTRQCSRFLDPKVLKMEGRPFSWWRW